MDPDWVDNKKLPSKQWHYHDFYSFFVTKNCNVVEMKWAMSQSIGILEN